MRQTLVTLALAPLSLAADATLTMFYPLNVDGNTPSATPDPSDIMTPSLSIISANPATTVAALGCGTDISSTDCYFNGYTYTAISTTVFKYHLETTIESNVPFTFDIACTGKSPAVTCTTDVPNADKISVSGLDPSDISDILPTGTTTYTGGEVSFLAAPVTAGQEKLQATPKESQSGTAGSQSGSPTPSPSKSGEKPAEQTGKNAAGRVGGKVGVVVGALGVAAAGLL